MSCQPIWKISHPSIDLMLFGHFGGGASIWTSSHKVYYTKQWILFCYIYTVQTLSLSLNACSLFNPFDFLYIDFDGWTSILIVKKFKRPTQLNNKTKICVYGGNESISWKTFSLFILFHSICFIFIALSKESKRIYVWVCVCVREKEIENGNLLRIYFSLILKFKQYCCL